LDKARFGGPFLLWTDNLPHMLDVLCIGHASFDVAMAVDSHPGPDEKIQARSMQLSGGGPAANAAVQVARLGGKSAFYGYLGRDAFADVCLDELEAEGVDTSLIVRGDAPTPVSQILAKPDGTRSVVNSKGHMPWLPGNAADLSAMRVKAVLFDGHEPLLSGQAMAWAKLRRIPTILDAGSLHRGTSALAFAVDYLVASAKFARQVCGARTVQHDMEQLAAQRNRVVITLGEAGLIWFRDEKTGSLPAPAVQVVDSTGAGDAFHGAFALAIARNMGWLDALRFASKAGALACTKLGARQGLPYREDMENFAEQ